MCTVAALASPEPDPPAVIRLAEVLFQGRVRGMHAFGLGWATEHGGLVRRCFAGRAGLADAVMLLRRMAAGERPCPRLMIAHCRYSTSGDWRDASNNQPIAAGGRLLAVNGVLSQAPRAEYERDYGVKCVTDNDGEIFLRLLERGEWPEQLLKAPRPMGVAPWSFAGCWLESGVLGATLRAGRNRRRPLYRATLGHSTFLASTADILLRAGAWGGTPQPLPAGRVLAWR